MKKYIFIYIIISFFRGGENLLLLMWCWKTCWWSVQKNGLTLRMIKRGRLMQAVSCRFCFAKWKFLLVYRSLFYKVFAMAGWLTKDSGHGRYDLASSVVVVLALMIFTIIANAILSGLLLAGWGWVLLLHLSIDLGCYCFLMATTI